MTTKLFAAVLAVLSLSMTSAAQAAVHGRQAEAPPWSFACINDSGPTQCGEPTWIYGDR
jgi:hypothetical protein